MSCTTRGREVLAHAEALERALRDALLGHERQTAPDRLGRRADAQRLAVEP